MKPMPRWYVESAHRRALLCYFHGCMASGDRQAWPPIRMPVLRRQPRRLVPAPERAAWVSLGGWNHRSFYLPRHGSTRVLRSRWSAS